MAKPRRTTLRPTQKEIDRFWSHVDRSGGPNACWPWLLSCLKSGGYGQTWFCGQMYRANRVAFFLMHKRWPKPFALHTCDNPPCCNFNHLYEGTPKNNMDDCIKRGRIAFGNKHGSKTHPECLKRGEQHPNAKFTTKIINAVRKAVGTQSAIAKKFGMSQTHVSRIKLRQKRVHG